MICQRYKSWLSSHGIHSDGWSNRINQENLELILSTEKKQGFVWFYAYMPKSKSGDMNVCYRLKIKDLLYTNKLRPHNHLEGEHDLQHSGGKSDGGVRLSFQVLNIEDIDPVSPSDFVTSKGEHVKGGAQLLNILVVEQKSE